MEFLMTFSTSAFSAAGSTLPDIAQPPTINSRAISAPQSRLERRVILLPPSESRRPLANHHGRDGHAFLPHSAKESPICQDEFAALCSGGTCFAASVPENIP